MQPFQYDLRSSAAKNNSITHAAAAPSNLDAATTMRPAETELQNTIELRVMASEIAAPKPDFDAKATKKLKGILKGKLLAPKLRQSSDKSLSQPGCSHFNNTIYNLQLQKTIVLRMQPRHEATLTRPHSNAIYHHSFKKCIELRTQEEPLVVKHIGGTIRAKKNRSRTRRTDEVPFIVGCSHFTRKNTRFRAPASSPKHSPCNIHAAITMRFAASRGKPAPIYARGNIKWRKWSSYSNVICNQRFKNRMELRTQTQPLIAKHIGGIIRAQNDRSRTRRTDEVPFIVGCSHFIRKNTRFRAPASSPKHSPCNIYVAITMRFVASPWQTCTYLRTWQHQMTTMKQPFQCNLQPEIQEPHRTTHIDTTTRCKT